MLRYKHLKSTFFLDTFYATGKAKSTHRNTFVQLFVSDKDYVTVYPVLDTKSYLYYLKAFAKDVGAPDILVCDSHPTEEVQSTRVLTQIGTTLHVLEANTQWAN